MRIFNEDDVEITEDDVNHDLGHLVQDYKLIKIHEEIPPTGETGHTQVVVNFTDGTNATFDNGYPTEYFDENRNFIPTNEYDGKEVESIKEEYIIDTPYNPGEPEWYENEEILRYVLYTEEQLKEIEEQKKQEQAQVEAVNTYNNLLATVDDMVLVMADDVGAYNETDEHISDLTLAMADIIGGV